MVVATSATKRQPEEHPAERVDLLVDDVHPHLGLVDLGEHLGADGHESGRDQQLVALRFATRREQVAGYLFDDEAVERLVAVERGDDIVAIAPGVAVGDVLVQPVGVGIARDVKPMPPPALAVSHRSEQSINEPGIGIGTRVGEKALDLAGGRQAGQSNVTRRISVRLSAGSAYGRDRLLKLREDEADPPEFATRRCS